MSAKTLEQCIDEIMLEHFATGDGRTSTDRIADEVTARYPEVVQNERERLIRLALHDMILDEMQRSRG